MTLKEILPPEEEDIINMHNVPAINRVGNASCCRVIFFSLYISPLLKPTYTYLPTYRISFHTFILSKSNYFICQNILIVCNMLTIYQRTVFYPEDFTGVYYSKSFLNASCLQFSTSRISPQ